MDEPTEKAGVDKFVSSTLRFMEKVASALDEAVEKEDISIDEAVKLADLIYRIMMTAKLMKDAPPAKPYANGKEEAPDKYTPTRSFLDRSADAKNQD